MMDGDDRRESSVDVGPDGGEGSPDIGDEPQTSPARERVSGPKSPATRVFSPTDDPHRVRSTAQPVGAIGVPVYVGAAANVLDEIRKQHCLGRAPGSVLREHITRRGGSAAILQSGRWQVVPCTSLEEAIDFRAYLVQRLKPLLDSDGGPWKREYSVLYHRFVQELYASEAVGCDGLKGTFAGPGVYIFYHNDKSLWQPLSESPQASIPSEFGLLKKAIALSRAGDRRPALEVLAHVISANPHSELAWLWYAYNLERNSDRIKVLEECLTHNPECKEAKDRLIYLQTTEALRVRIEERRKGISDQIADAEARLGRLQTQLLEEEKRVQKAEEACESAKTRAAATRGEIARLTVELDQLREQLAEL